SHCKFTTSNYWISNFICNIYSFFLFFFQAGDGIRARNVTGVQTCALPILLVQGLGLAGGGALGEFDDQVAVVDGVGDVDQVADHSAGATGTRRRGGHLRVRLSAVCSGWLTVCTTDPDTAGCWAGVRRGTRRRRRSGASSLS